MELKNVQEPVQRLRKALKRLPEDATVDEVHKLRTLTRRLEATLSALQLGSAKDVRRLLKALKPVRKAAGVVRDMDVLSAKVLGLAGEQKESALVRLVEHLGESRMKSARRLFATVGEQRSVARRGLKRQSERMEEELAKNRGANETSRHAVAAGVALAEELGRWPGLTVENLHAFRLKVKELRYVLQAGGDGDARFIEGLGEVKDRIGEWHDWAELARIAGEVLDDGDGRELLRRIKSIERTMLREALTAANAMRRSFLDEAKAGSPRPARRSTAMKGVEAVAALAG